MENLQPFFERHVAFFHKQLQAHEEIIFYRLKVHHLLAWLLTHPEPIENLWFYGHNPDSAHPLQISKANAGLSR